MAKPTKLNTIHTASVLVLIRIQLKVTVNDFFQCTVFRIPAVRLELHVLVT